MAKNDNLTDFLTDVANAIREKKGTTDLINPQNFSDEIASIETGGGGGAAVSANDVNFRDYDGTILHSYSKDEFLALSELPALPTQQGLICQEWNYSLEDAQSYVADYGRIEVGATYITDDGKTRLYISVPRGRQNVPLYFLQTVANGVTIDWGDGSALETLSGTDRKNTTHNYASEGDYVISLEVAEGCTLGLGNNTSSNCVLGSTGNKDKVYCNMLQRVEIGQGVTSIGISAFNSCYSLTSVVIPKNVTSFGQYSFQSCYSLASIVIPNGVTSLGMYTFAACYSLVSIVVPKSVTSFRMYAFRGCYSLASIVVPNSVTSFETGVFSDCHSLVSMTLPNGITSIASSTFNTCYSLAFVVIPNSVTSIESQVWYYCYGMAFLDFTTLTSVPKLTAINAFTNIPSDCKIVVPDSLYDEWIAATNWSSYASYIVKASEFNG